MNDAKQMTMNDKELWALVLAAGKSERMGTQKLLLPIGKQTMIGKVIHNILAAGLKNIMVVLGSDGDKVASEISQEPVQSCVNLQYAEGMHTSVICGIRNLPETAAAVIVFLGDMPFIPVQAALKVIHSWQQTRKKIVVPAYKGYRGHPTLFDLQLREEIIRMDHHAGLRSVITRFPEEVLTVPVNFSAILRDIDTKNDYLDLLNQINK